MTSPLSGPAEITQRALFCMTCFQVQKYREDESPDVVVVAEKLLGDVCKPCDETWTRKLAPLLALWPLPEGPTSRRP